MNCESTIKMHRVVHVLCKTEERQSFWLALRVEGRGDADASVTHTRRFIEKQIGNILPHVPMCTSRTGGVPGQWTVKTENSECSLCTATWARGDGIQTEKEIRSNDDRGEFAQETETKEDLETESYAHLAQRIDACISTPHRRRHLANTLQDRIAKFIREFSSLRHTIRQKRDGMYATAAMARLLRSQCRRPQAALELLQQVLSSITPPPSSSTPGFSEVQFEMGLCLEACGLAADALEVLDSIEMDSVCYRNEALVCRAKSLYALGKRQEAASIVMNVLGCEPDQRPRDALIEYARIAIETSVPRSPARRDAIAVLVDLAARERMGQRMPAALRDLHRLLLAYAASEPGGVEAIVSCAGGEARAQPSALAFIGTVVREGGETDITITLLAKAAERSPGDASIALNLAHAHELHGAAREAILAARRPFEIAAERGGPLVSTEIDVGVLECTRSLSAPIPLYAADNKDFAFNWLVDDNFERKILDDAVASAAIAARKRMDADDTALRRRRGDSNAATSRGSQPSPDGVAVAFTIVKILFVHGSLERASCLAEILGSHASLVQSTLVPDIANEAAFFTCISSVLRRTDAPVTTITSDSGADASLPVAIHSRTSWIFVAGDSHVLPLAWRPLRLRGEARRLFPLLVTGLKLWHLRDGSRFYTRQGFERTVTSCVPSGSQLVLVLGELDCREGVSGAVAKCNVESEQEALCALLDVYMNEIAKLTSRKVEVFIHPPPPVLEPSRQRVLRFTSLLRNRIAEAYHHHQRPRGAPVHFLDMDALVPGLTASSPDLHLDGTHLSPEYLPMLQAAIDRVAPAPSSGSTTAPPTTTTTPSSC